MCNPACIEFGKSHFTQDEVSNKKVIEVGSLDVNGSVRKYVEKLEPQSYLGVDIVDGPGVDEICDISRLVTNYDVESFDVVICTEVIEHVRNWRGAISNLKMILKPSGVLLLTTRSIGFHYHAYPYDFWRYEVEDIREIFSDLSIDAITKDSYAPGVFLKARKPVNFVEYNTDEIELYSVIARQRRRKVSIITIFLFRAKWLLWRLLSRILPASAQDRIRNSVLRDTQV